MKKGSRIPVEDRKYSRPRVMFGGLPYYRDKAGYYYCRGPRELDVKRPLHRDVWQGRYGYLDPELVIHHIDFDRENNAPENLQAMTNSDHMRLHSNRPGAYSGSEANLRNLREAKKKSIEWSRTPAGRQHMREKSLKMWENRVHVKKECLVCEAKYTTQIPERTKFCSKKCRSRAKYRRDTGRPINNALFQKHRKEAKKCQ